MSEALVSVFRAVSLLAVLVPLLLASTRRGRASRTRGGQARGGRAPVVANVTACGVLYLSLLAFSGAREGKTALLLALTGCLLAAAGAAIVLRSRLELGPAWSLAPIADEATGLVTTGPYRLVRHPIYLGFSMLALGQALAFARWPAFVVLLAAVLPTFVWRALAEEKLLTATFGDRYTRYQTQTTLIIPHLL
jgi:protein-S-isoprenylcysteine O-methyltransferase Ste14